MRFSTASSERLRIDSSGRVGIGYTTPSSQCEIVESHDSTGAGTHTKVLKLSTTGYATGQGPKLEFGTTDNIYSAWIYADICSEYEGGAFGGAILFRTNSGSSTTSVSERFRIKRDGNVRINNGDLQVYGTDNGIIGLGVNSSTYGKVNISVAGSDASGSNNVATFSRESGSSAIELHFPAGGGINFNSTANASQGGASHHDELLDDYEEGRWNPGIDKSASSMSGVSYSNTTGTYTRVGRLVTVWFDITLTGGGTSGSGAPYITELPFAVVTGDTNDNGGYGAPQFRDATLTHGNFRIYGNSSYFANSQIYLQQYNSNGGTENSSINGTGRITGQGTYFTS